MTDFVLVEACLKASTLQRLDEIAERAGLLLSPADLKRKALVIPQILDQLRACPEVFDGSLSKFQLELTAFANRRSSPPSARLLASYAVLVGAVPVDPRAFERPEAATAPIANRSSYPSYYDRSPTRWDAPRSVGSSYVRDLVARGVFVAVNQWRDLRTPAVDLSPDSLLLPISAYLVVSPPPAPHSLPTTPPLTALLALGETVRRLQALPSGLRLTQGGFYKQSDLRLLVGHHASETDVHGHLDLLIGLGALGRDRSELTFDIAVWRSSLVGEPSSVLQQTLLLRGIAAKPSQHWRDAEDFAELMLEGLRRLAGPVPVAEFAATFARGAGGVHANFTHGYDDAATLEGVIRELLAADGPLARQGLFAHGEIAGVAHVAPPASFAPSTAYLSVVTNFEIVVYLQNAPLEMLETLQCAQLERVDAYTAVFTLTRASVRQWLDRHEGIDALLEGLERASLTPLPSNMISTLRDWAKSADRVRVTHDAVVLEYATRAERDAALGRVGAALGERFIVRRNAPSAATCIDYNAQAGRVLDVDASGRLAVFGEHFGARWLERVALDESKTITPDGARRVGSRFVGLLELYSARTLEPGLRARLLAWSGAMPAPSLESVELLQFAGLEALRLDAEVASALSGVIAHDLALVKPGQLATLRARLRTLEYEPAEQLQIRSNLGASSAPQEPGHGSSSVATPSVAVLQKPTARAARALIEAAMLAGQFVLIKCEVERYNQWRQYVDTVKNIYIGTPLMIEKEDGALYITLRLRGTLEVKAVRLSQIDRLEHLERLPESKPSL